MSPLGDDRDLWGDGEPISERLLDPEPAARAYGIDDEYRAARGEANLYEVVKLTDASATQLRMIRHYCSVMAEHLDMPDDAEDNANAEIDVVDLTRAFREAALCGFAYSQLFKATGYALRVHAQLESDDRVALPDADADADTDRETTGDRGTEL